MRAQLFLVLLVVCSVMLHHSAFAFRRHASALLPRSLSASRVAAVASAKPVGSAGTMEYRLSFQDESGRAISPWHDIPLKAPNSPADVFNFIVEIPKFTRAKLEVATKEAHNPIAQDVKKGKLRDYHGPIFWNYGCIPQTWEDPHVVHPELQCKGDNDPVDVVEIGAKPIPSGSISQVKVLGVLAMIDDGELDWKVIGINTEDPLSAQLNDIDDIEAKLPGVVSGIREWFRWYKTPDDKPLNKFGFDDKALNKNHALKVIEETHHHWKELVAGKSDAGKLWVTKPSQ